MSFIDVDVASFPPQVRDAVNHGSDTQTYEAPVCFTIPLSPASINRALGKCHNLLRIWKRTITKDKASLDPRPIRANPRLVKEATTWHRIRRDSRAVYPAPVYRPVNRDPWPWV